MIMMTGRLYICLFERREQKPKYPEKLPKGAEKRVKNEFITYVAL